MYIYSTVNITFFYLKKNGANLAQLLIKVSKLNNGNEHLNSYFSTFSGASIVSKVICSFVSSDAHMCPRMLPCDNTCSPLPTHAHICPYMLMCMPSHAHMGLRVLTCAYTCSRVPTRAHVCPHKLTCAYTSLTCAHMCSCVPSSAHMCLCMPIAHLDVCCYTSRLSILYLCDLYGPDYRRIILLLTH
jgi:hypothetical protein